MRFTWLVLLLGVTLSLGCAETKADQLIRETKAARGSTPPPAPPHARKEPVALCPSDPLRAIVCVYRNQFSGRASTVDVQLDGHTVAQLENDKYLQLSLRPGSHELQVFTRVGNPSSMSLGGEPGSVTYFGVQMEDEGRFAVATLKEKKADEAETQMRTDCTLSAKKVIGEPAESPIGKHSTET